MCTKKEVQEVVDNSLLEMKVIQKTIAETIVEIKGFLSNLPCNAYNEKIIGLEFSIKNIEKDVADFEKDRDVLYNRTRENGEKIVGLETQNEGQDKDSTKVWMIIMIVISFAFNLVGWFLR